MVDIPLGCSLSFHPRWNPSDLHRRTMLNSNQSKIDFDRVCAFVQSSYWGEGRSADDIRKAFRNSLCFSAFYDSEQIGFARVLTDTRYFAYLCDVFVFEEHRGCGYSKLLMATILDHEKMKHVRWAMLATRDAHGLYEEFGFEPVAGVEKLMERRFAP